MVHKKRRGRPANGSLSERAYSLIREKILRGEIPLGAALSRRQLAAEYGMSFLPISEAIKRLEHEGLVESRPRVGTRVRIPTAQDVRDCYLLREALEGLAARLFAEKATFEEQAELQTMAKRVDAMMADASGPETDPEALFRAQAYHFSFHMRIAECTGSTALRDAIEKNHTLIFNWLYDITAKLPMPPRRHEELMDALSGNDPELAEAAMRRHIKYGLREVQAAIATHFGPGIGHLGRSEPPPAGMRAKPDGSWRARQC